MGVGWTYPDEDIICSVHNAPMMFHTCAGGPGEPLGYCEAAPDHKSCRWDEETVSNG